ncbi:hypothetical protein RHMOL_Rhmol04G0083900 [Rhododendron molle]|uniref:Uncharacterized protein n=1 Tax=Rhododendron molle TaxID=49168 RepID=A0ACC0NYI8_RHOML|nr:hypothetical protein RHMOL_Rhmol04G0083900 [Rhododendron molle]
MADQDSQQTYQRRSANYQPTAWDSDFIKSLKNHNIGEIQKHRAKKLKGEIKAMIGDRDVNSLTIVKLIDDIQRLGLSHHFQKDITRALDRIFLSVNGNGTNLRADQQISVHATALCFRLCRQHGYEASQDLFRKFKNKSGNFMESLCKDIKGLLSLMSRLEARCYIEAYGKRNDAHLLLLEMAKLDFNMVQSLLQGELKDMSSDCRKSSTKLISLINTIDDIYDVYGYLDELQLFTVAVDRWDIKAAETLPDYMKFCFLALYNTTNEMAYEILKQKGVNIIPYLTRAWVDYCNAILVEAKWYFEKGTPTFKAYLESALVSASMMLVSVHAYFLLTETITKEAMECFEKEYHPLIECPSLIFRLSNDLATSKAEFERGETASSIMCCMHETGLSEEEARKHIRKLIDEA